MRFRRKVEEKRRVKATLDLTPLIDVVFQLIIFFMLSSTFVVQSSIPIEMAQAEGATNLENRDLSISLVYDPNVPTSEMPIYVDDVPVTGMAELARVLAAIQAERPDVAALIRPDKRIQVERLIEVMGIAKNVGIRMLNVAAEPASDDGP